MEDLQRFYGYLPRLCHQNIIRYFVPIPFIGFCYYKLFFQPKIGATSKVSWRRARLASNWMQVRVTGCALLWHCALGQGTLSAWALSTEEKMGIRFQNKKLDVNK